MRNSAQNLLKEINKGKRGFTLIEVIIVMAMMAAMVTLFVGNYRRSYANQALRTTAERMASVLRGAHIYSREVEGEKEWGLRWIDDTTYALVTRDVNLNIEEEKEYEVEDQVSIPIPFDYIWFLAGTGEANMTKIIKLESSFGNTIELEVLKSGLIEIGEMK